MMYWFQTKKPTKKPNPPREPVFATNGHLIRKRDQHYCAIPAAPYETGFFRRKEVNPLALIEGDVFVCETCGAEYELRYESLSDDD